MDELGLAQKAVRKSLLSEDQLREAQSFAAGGRSLLAVLLELGYLRPQDIADLAASGPRPATSARSPLKTFLLIVLVAGITAALTRSCASEERFRHEAKLAAWLSPPRPENLPPSSPGLTERAVSLIGDPDHGRREAGSLTAEQERQIQRAAALLETAISDGDTRFGAYYHLGRAYELLDRWEQAAGAYRDALKRDETDGFARLGLARMLLLLDRPIQAHAEATAAADGPTAGEAHLVRAKAEYNLGNRAAARAELDLALQKDPSLADAVRVLRGRIGP